MLYIAMNRFFSFFWVLGGHIRRVTHSLTFFTLIHALFEYLLQAIEGVHQGKDNIKIQEMKREEGKSFFKGMSC